MHKLELLQNIKLTIEWGVYYYEYALYMTQYVPLIAIAYTALNERTKFWKP